MQKLCFLFLLVLLSSCHKELMAPEVDEMEVVQSYLQKRLDAATINLLDWSKAEAIHSGEVTVGYKIPLVNSTSATYRFILVDAVSDKMKGVFRNDIQYARRPEGLIPEKITNYDFQTGLEHVYGTHEMIAPSLPGIQMTDSLATLARTFKVPAMTAIGIYNNDGTASKPSSIKEIRTYLLAYLLGLDVGGIRGKVLKEAPSGIHFYNPLFDAEKDKNMQVIEWEIGQ
ncbi:MAG TPA: hypothetical protein VLL95_05190 [Phnomibacter sp.]|nr:hypothetical protein [Phnomibacter sp.]